MTLPSAAGTVVTVLSAIKNWNYNYPVMSERSQKLARIAVAAHPQISDGLAEARTIAEALEQQGISSWHGLLYDDELKQQLLSGDIDLLIALGGDGTMLRAGRMCGPIGIPILGINMGRFGFLIEIRQNQWHKILPRLLEGDFWLERRMMLASQQWRGESCLGSWEVVNEVVVSRGQFVRPIRIQTLVDKRFLATYVADGLIAASPTGSTAYALAAGGPILPPESRNILLVPVAPHLSIDRAIVLSEGSSVSMVIHSDHQAVLALDGQTPIELQDGDRVEACASEHSVLFVRFQDPGYFYRDLTSHMNQNPSASNPGSQR